MAFLLIVNTIIMAVLAAIWKKEDFLNFSIKFILGGVAGLNLFFVLNLLGFVVKT